MFSLLESYVIDIEDRLNRARLAEKSGGYEAVMDELERAEALLHQAKTKMFHQYLYQSGVPGVKK